MTDPRQAPLPADAAMLREVADEDESEAGQLSGRRSMDGDVAALLHRAARLRALADQMEREAEEAKHRTARCQECSQPVRPDES
jgi:hypothetical protein